MPLQNRVNPFGEIVAVAAKGDLMGNRGCLHNDRREVVRNHRGKAWIACVTSWPGVRRQLMTPGSYTELFFRDEATALAAGHRPCAECRRDRFRAFQAAWVRAGLSGEPPRVAVMDDRLHRERSEVERPIADPAAEPDGVIVSPVGSVECFLKWKGNLYRWSFDGYGPAEPMPNGAMRRLTPASIAAVLAAGYVPGVHVSVDAS